MYVQQIFLLNQLSADKLIIVIIINFQVFLLLLLLLLFLLFLRRLVRTTVVSMACALGDQECLDNVTQVFRAWINNGQ